jgi:hypothetical protein
VVCLHNHCVNGNTALCSLCTVMQPVTSKNIKILDVLQHAFVVNCLIFLSDVHQVPISFTDIKKVAYIKFHKNTSRGSHADTCEQKDGHDEGEMCFSQLCGHA